MTRPVTLKAKLYGAGDNARGKKLNIGFAATTTIKIGLSWGASPATDSGAAEPIPVAVNSTAAPEPTASASPSDEPTEEPEAKASAGAEQEVSKWAIASNSRLRFSTTWSGEAIAGGFSKFSGDIAFDPERLGESKVTITVVTGSVFSGDASRDETLRGTDWFAVGANRNSVFQADSFRKTGADRYVAQGTLRMKGDSAPLSIPFSLRVAGDRVTMRGSATIDRLAYKIGEGEFASTAEIPAAVAIDIAVSATRR